MKPAKKRNTQDWKSTTKTEGGGYKTYHFSQWLVLFHEVSSDWSYKSQIRKKIAFSRNWKIWTKAGIFG